MWDETTYGFLNFNGAVVEVWEKINDFIPHFNGHVIFLPILVHIELFNTPNQASFQTATHLDETQTNPVAHMDWKQTPQVSLCPWLNIIRSIAVSWIWRSINSQVDFHEQNGHDAGSTGNYLAQSWMKILGICKFHDITGIMTGLLGCLLWSILGLMANHYVSTFDFIIHPEPSGVLQTATAQPRSLSPK